MVEAEAGEPVVSCRELERWLDLGMPGLGSEVALAHARACPRCAAALAAAREVESMLAAMPRPAPAAFTDRVMARVGDARAIQARVPAVPVTLLSWWVRAPAEPAAALAVLAAGLVVWQRGALWASATHVALGLGQAVGGVPVAPSLGATFGRPEVLLGLALAATPAAGWASWALFRWAERRAGVTAAR